MEVVARNHATIGSLLGQDLEEERSQLRQMVDGMPDIIAFSR
jgi:hypothetical protein